jgi:putative spermidine/putrescine transport system permease protein
MKRLVDDLFFWAFCLLGGGTVLFLLAPVFVSIAMAFDGRSYLGPFPPSDLSLQWFHKLFANDYLLKGLRTSLLLAVVTSFISMAVGTLAAFGLERMAFRGREALMAFFLSPLLIPGVILGFGLLLLFSLFDILEGLPRLVAGHVLITFPFCLRTTLASLVGIRRSLTEAAMSLGANERQAFWDVTFPLARTGIMAGGIFAFALSMDDVVVSLFLADPHTYTLPIALVSTMKSNFDLTIAAASLFLLALTGAIIWMLARVVGLGRLLGQGVYRS